MRNLILFLVFITLPFSGFSQKKNPKKRPIPPPVPEEYIAKLSTDTLTLQDGALPVLFLWEMNADTTLNPNTVFKELISLKFGETELNSSYSLETITLKKTKGNKKLPAAVIPKVIVAQNYCDAELSNGILTLKARDKPIMKFRVVYDRNKQLSHLLDLSDNTIYKHIESDEPVIALPAY